MRIGFGYDAHRLIAGTEMVLGGVSIESDFSIESHSDGDLIIHSLIDSLLGATALGDIGSLFPSNKSDYRNISSRKMLNTVMEILEKNNYRIINVDITLIAEEPELKDYVEEIRKNLSEDLNIGKEFVSCKATTTDGLGFEGIKKGISCTAISLVDKTVKEKT
tara:strand:- start:3746 stop:4234 length:489 start_codon:yes stop_codon:yes gene_type:complete